MSHVPGCSRPEKIPRPIGRKNTWGVLPKGPGGGCVCVPGGSPAAALPGIPILSQGLAGQARDIRKHFNFMILFLLFSIVFPNEKRQDHNVGYSENTMI